MISLFGRRTPPTVLKDRATIMVIGGGPAGAFFAIKMLRRVRRTGKTVELLILEKKKEPQFYERLHSISLREGCNYCAGGISPRLADVLDDLGLTLPEHILQGKVESLTVHGDWKNIELPIPAGRRMLSVFRGSRPKDRTFRHMNFDAYLLEKAVGEGATVITGEAQDVCYSSTGKPIVTYRPGTAEKGPSQSKQVDFVVFAGGVNQTPGVELRKEPLYKTIRRLVPEFRPPKVRRSLICELQADEKIVRSMKGEVHFAQYGSKTLQVEMSSLIPKTEVITVVLLGKSVDRAERSDVLQIVQEFLQLPHIRRLLPKQVELNPICTCNPNMAIGAARSPFGDRTALIGDMAVSRLYKDGILSAYLTASGLVDSILYVGVDRESLRRSYWPEIKRIRRDVRFGRLVFLLNRVTFASPFLSRILYQAVLTERRAKPQYRRRLADLLWKIASGDDTYGRILASMFHPATLGRIAVGGFLITLRNLLTERLFGLKWEGFGRYPTGIPKETFEEKRREFADLIEIEGPRKRPEFESMYSIRIKGTRERILHQLDKFGDLDRDYLTPRMIKVHRTAGNADEVGSVVQYDLPFRFLSFSIVLERVVDRRRRRYRVRNGFAQGGVLIFDVSKEREGVFSLSTYVGFNFPRPKNPIKRLAWRVFKAVFPGFAHDVLWNHSLCKLKDLVEMEEELPGLPVKTR